MRKEVPVGIVVCRPAMPANRKPKFEDECLCWGRQGGEKKGAYWGALVFHSCLWSCGGCYFTGEFLFVRDFGEYVTG